MSETPPAGDLRTLDTLMALNWQVRIREEPWPMGDSPTSWQITASAPVVVNNVRAGFCSSAPTYAQAIEGAARCAERAIRRG